jgi:hypothetical protein
VSTLAIFRHGTKKIDEFAYRQPIATIEQYKAALLALRDSGLPLTYLVMLRAQYRAPSHTITATQLAQAAGYKNYNAANLHYGTMGRLIALQLSFSPDKRKDGTERWWKALSYEADGDDDTADAHFKFVMRPELVSALQQMRWA